MDFSDSLVDYVDKFYIKPSEMINVIYIIIGIFLGFIAISSSVEKFPSFLPKEIVLIIILVLMMICLNMASRASAKTNKKVLEIKRYVMIDPQHVNNLDSSSRSELLNQLDLTFTKKDEKALENCKNILTRNKI